MGIDTSGQREAESGKSDKEPERGGADLRTEKTHAKAMQGFLLSQSENWKVVHQG